MNPYVKSVDVLYDYLLYLVFENGERRLFDVKSYLSRGIFSRLKNPALFRAARVMCGSVEWPDGLDLSYDTLYIEGRPISLEDIQTEDTISG